MENNFTQSQFGKMGGGVLRMKALW